MAVRRLVAIVGGAAVAMTLTLPGTPAYATQPNDVYVATPADGGDDAHDCSQASPCATVGAGIMAVASEGTVHVGAGTFDGELRPGAVSKSVVITGVGTSNSGSGTVLTAASSGDGFVLEVGEETTTLSHLRIQGGSYIDVLVDGTGTVVADDVVLGHSGCNLVVETGASATLTDSTVEEGGSPGCVTPTPFAEIAMSGGSVSLVHTQVLDAAVNVSGVEMSGGTFTADQSTFDDSANDIATNDSSGLKVTGGTATVTRSTFHGWGFQGVRVAGGSALVTDDTFQDNLVGVDVDSGSATVVRSTFQHELGSVQSTGSGTLSVAGSVLGSVDGSYGIKNCVGIIIDLGYDLSTDDTCNFAFRDTSRVVTPAQLNLDTALADRGGPPGLTTVAIFNPSAAMDTIPVGAVYGDSNSPLCPASGATDLRGVPRPVGNGCDAGSYEMSGTSTTLSGPAKAKPHADVTFDALVVAPDVIPGTEAPAGTVTFTSGGTVLCEHVPFGPGPARHALCTTSALGAGLKHVVATFEPAADASTLHGSASAPLPIEVGTIPAFTSPGRTTFVVGKRTTFTVRASGSPVPRVTLVKGRLPAGLTFHANNGRATISGTAKGSAVGTHTVTLQARNLMGTVKQVLRIVVKR